MQVCSELPPSVMMIQSITMVVGQHCGYGHDESGIADIEDY